MKQPDLSGKTIEKVKLEGSLLDLKCKNCGDHIPVANFNVNNTIAKCESCNSVFSFEDDIFFKPRRGRPEFTMPEGTDVLHFTDNMEVRIDWMKSVSKGGLLFLSLFTLIWCGILAGIIGGMIAAGVGVPILFLSGHILVGGGLIYFLLGKFLNITDIQIDKDNVYISQKPIKSIFSRDKTIPRSHIKQLFVTKYVASRTNDRPNYAFRLDAKLKNGKIVKLVGGMNKETQLYVEQEIERFLNIDDLPVTGETLE